MDTCEIKIIIESLLFSATEPISIDELMTVFNDFFPKKALNKADILHAIEQLNEDYQERSIEICEVASGFRFQVRTQYISWIQKLLPEKQERYSQAVLETLALIAYRQPITRGEIEQIRGVSVSSQTIKTLLEREWVRILGPKQVPGKPMLYGTTAKFLNDFSLSSLDQLPKIAEQSLEEQQGEFAF